ncbi:MAG: hypothetical protein KDD36_02910 [Flavobacteriales bacterium]|nr:hypothetical protein [Flavobacteriales bacterium]
MRNASKFALALVFVAGAMFTGCKKYEEGPMISFKSKKARIQRVWEESKYIDSNGNESTPSPKHTYELKEDQTVSVDGGASSTAFTWDFDDKKEGIVFTTTVGSVSSTDKVTILRLTSKELWIKDSNNDQTQLVAK